MPRWSTVVETRPYLARAEKIMGPAERENVVKTLAEAPAAGDVMPGTGGVRKVRFRVGDHGKSGGVRVIYYFHSDTMPVYLLTVFAKNERANLSRAERNALASLVDTILRERKD